MRAWGWTPLALAGALGCQAVVQLPQPPSRSASSLLVWMQGDSVMQVIARDADSAAVELGSFSRSTAEADADSFALFEVSFSCPLNAMGLSPGLVELEPSPSPSARLEVPAPEEVLELAIGKGQRSWSTTPDPSAVLDKLRGLPIPAGNLCKLAGSAFDATNATAINFQQLPLTFDGLFIDSVVPLEPGLFLMSMSFTNTPTSTRQLLISQRGAEPTELVYRSRGVRAGLPLGRLAAAADRSLWFVSQTGSVAHGTYQDGLDVVGRLGWPGTRGSTVSGRVTNLWFVTVGGEERLFAGYVKNEGSYLEQPEAAVLEYRGADPPRVVDGLSGFGNPWVAPSPSGGLLIAGLGMDEGHLHEARLNPSGAWEIHELLLPPKPASFGEDAMVPTWATTLPDGNIRVGVTALSVKLGGNIRYLNVPLSALAEGPIGQLHWLGESEGPGEVITDMAELPGGLLAQVGINKDFVATVSLYQHGVRRCTPRAFHQVQDFTLATAGTYFDIHRAFLAPLDDESIAFLPTHSMDVGFVFRRPHRAPGCLEGR